MEQFKVNCKDDSEWQYTHRQPPQEGNCFAYPVNTIGSYMHGKYDSPVRTCNLPILSVCYRHILFTRHETDLVSQYIYCLSGLTRFVIQIMWSLYHTEVYVTKMLSLFLASVEAIIAQFMILWHFAHLGWIGWKELLDINTQNWHR